MISTEEPIQLTISEVTEWIGVPESTVVQWIKDDHLDVTWIEGKPFLEFLSVLHQSFAEGGDT